MAWWHREPDGQLKAGSRFAHHMAFHVLAMAFRSAAAAILIFLLSKGQFEDLYVKARGTAPTSDHVTVMTIGDEALYLWDPGAADMDHTPRVLLAELVRFLDAAGASVIVLDVLLDQPQEGDDALLAAARDASAPVIAGERFVLAAPTSRREFEPGIALSLQDHVYGGFANLQVEQPWLFSEAELVRHAPLVRRVARSRLLPGRFPMNQVGAEQADVVVMPSMTLLAAASFRAAERGETPGHVLADLRLACTPEGESGLRCDDDVMERLGLPSVHAPLEQGITINFRGPEGSDGLDTVRAAAALRASAQASLGRELGVDMPLVVPPELEAVIRDRVVIVGRVDAGAGARDRHVTPYSFPALLTADMAGVRVQAHVIDTLLSGRHVLHARGWWVWICSVVLGLGVVGTRRRMSDGAHAVTWLASAVALLFFGILVFKWTDGVALGLGPLLAAILVPLLLVNGGAWSSEGAPT